uniref:Uncharacterized protein n=1 Tax=uncultured marine virus TaxID=186617 RepID=A0A0F7L6M7_9VIRU|nr:hypothetical protein [uncultured marine virus]
MPATTWADLREPARSQGTHCAGSWPRPRRTGTGAGRQRAGTRTRAPSPSGSMRSRGRARWLRCTSAALGRASSRRRRESHG